MTGSRLVDRLPVDPDSPGGQSGVDPLPVPTETVLGEINAYGWRYYALDGVPYERHMCLLGGGFGMVFTGLVSAIGNSRRRRQAEAFAAAQWRPLGPLRIAYTSERLLVWHRQAWWSVWLAAVIGRRWDSASDALELFFEAEAPYRLRGPEVRRLATWLGALDRTASPLTRRSYGQGPSGSKPCDHVCDIGAFCDGRQC